MYITSFPNNVFSQLSRLSSFNSSLLAGPHRDSSRENADLNKQNERGTANRSSCVFRIWDSRLLSIEGGGSHGDF